MEHSLGWQKAIEDLASNHVQIRQQYREIARWFPSVQMMRNHASGLVKVMTEAEKLRAFPSDQRIPAATVLLWAMQESTSPTSSLLPAPVNNTYSDHLHAEILLGPSDDSDDEHVSDGESSNDFIVLSDDEEEAAVEMVGPMVAAVEGDKEIPIDVEKLPDVGYLEEVGVTVKKEVQDEEELLSEKKCKKRKKSPIPVKVRHSERLKKLQE
ncbi:hypothetical protein ZWY2020_010058 [Hordeum vulgare]|nr:hypothetical protein ZWY2020_010058 [Hordeum vulgare]